VLDKIAEVLESSEPVKIKELENTIQELNKALMACDPETTGVSEDSAKPIQEPEVLENGNEITSIETTIDEVTTADNVTPIIPPNASITPATVDNISSPETPATVDNISSPDTPKNKPVIDETITTPLSPPPNTTTTTVDSVVFPETSSDENSIVGNVVTTVSLSTLAVSVEPVEVATPDESVEEEDSGEISNLPVETVEVTNPDESVEEGDGEEISNLPEYDDVTGSGDGVSSEGS
jgi:hypothetical protein